jgi:hypothetical protein
MSVGPIQQLNILVGFLKPVVTEPPFVISSLTWRSFSQSPISALKYSVLYIVRGNVVERVGGYTGNAKHLIHWATKNTKALIYILHT